MAHIRSEAKKVKKFYSKRNQVHLCVEGQSTFILKEFMDMTHFHTERRVYRKTKGLGLSPELLDWSEEDQSMELSYIEGDTVLEVLEVCENEGNIHGAVTLLHKVLIWLEYFYKLVGTSDGQMVYHDINLRNFMIHEDQVYGIDFECCDYGDLSYELVKVMAMYRHYDPIDSEFKQSVVHRLYELYYQERGYSHNEFWQMMDEEIEHILKRRKKNN